MIKSLVRKNLRNFQAYSSARSLYQTGVFMDANENSLGSVISNRGGTGLNLYPDPSSNALRGALGEYLGVSERNIIVGNGSDEIIDLLIRLFVEQDEEILILEPTYGMYRVTAEIAGVRVRALQLKPDFQIDVSELLAQITNKTKIIFLCSPNNPTGNLINEEDIEKICTNFKGIVVVDEAYIELASRQTLARRVPEFKNLVVLRTFSKAWGLAGLRVGYAVAPEEIIEYLDKIKLPYNLNRLSCDLAVKALTKREKMQNLCQKILIEREKLAKKLVDLGFEIYSSEANFLLVKYAGASEIARKLAVDYGIIIRDFGTKPMLQDCVRISVGTLRQNKLLIMALIEIIKENNEK